MNIISYIFTILYISCYQRNYGLMVLKSNSFVHMLCWWIFICIIYFFYPAKSWLIIMSRDMTKSVCAQRRLRSAWASALSDQSSLSAWRNFGSLATHWAHSEDSDQTGGMLRLIWVFAGCTLILLVLSCRGSNVLIKFKMVVKCLLSCPRHLTQYST